VSTTGVVTGVTSGTAVVTATSEGKSATAAVTVQPAVSFVLVSPGLVLIRKAGTVQLSVAAYDASNNRIVGRAVIWSSDDQAVATVDATGLVTTKKAGVVQITATIDGKSDSSIITVTN
jgi:lactocepin